VVLDAEGAVAAGLAAIPNFMRPFVILLGLIAWVWAIAVIIAQG
jgi:hypothetical protein